MICPALDRDRPGTLVPVCAVLIPQAPRCRNLDLAANWIYVWVRIRPIHSRRPLGDSSHHHLFHHHHHQQQQQKQKQQQHFMLMFVFVFVFLDCAVQLQVYRARVPREMRTLNSCA